MAADTNYGNQAYLYVQSYSTPVGNIRPILKFDFSSLPANAVITAATLNLYYYATGSDPVGRTYWAYELTQAGWTEAGATWNKYDGANAWGTAGGDFITTDGASVGMPAGYGWVGWNVLALVQHFQSSHEKVAHFLIKDGTEDAVSFKNAQFYSSEYAVDTSLCPKLILTYYQNLTHSLDDVMSMSDEERRGTTLYKSDAFTISDSHGIPLFLVLSDAIGLSDSSSKSSEFLRSLSDILSPLDSHSLGPVLSQSDVVTLSDEISKTFGLSKADTLSLLDAYGFSFFLKRSDTFMLSDSRSSASSFFRSFSDILHLTDFIIWPSLDAFRFENLRLQSPLLGTQGPFQFEKISQPVPTGQAEGLFEFTKDNLFSFTEPGISIGAFQKDAFQEDAFQISETVSDSDYIFEFNPTKNQSSDNEGSFQFDKDNLKRPNIGIEGSFKYGH